MPLLNANNPPGRILLWELMALRESALNGYSPTRKVLVCVLWRKVRFLKGERGKPIYWCMLFRTNFLLSFLGFFPFLSVFVLIFFLFPLALFFFSPCELYPLFFDPLLQGTARASL